MRTATGSWMKWVNVALMASGVAPWREAADCDPDVLERPARDHAVIAQDDQPGEDAEPSGQSPAAPGSQASVGPDRISLGLPAQRQLGQHDRDTDQKGGDHIDQNEGASSVLSRLCGEPPDIAEPDGGADHSQDEAEAGAPVASLVGPGGCAHAVFSENSSRNEVP